MPPQLYSSDFQLTPRKVFLSCTSLPADWSGLGVIYILVHASHARTCSANALEFMAVSYLFSVSVYSYSRPRIEAMQSMDQSQCSVVSDDTVDKSGFRITGQLNGKVRWSANSPSYCCSTCSPAPPTFPAFLHHSSSGNTLVWWWIDGDVHY